MNISTSNSTAGAQSAFQKPDASALADRIFKQADKDKDGAITQDELAGALKNAPKPPGGGKAPDAADIFKKMDGNGDGKITKDELTSALKQGMAKQPAGGPPPGGGRPPGGASANSASATTDSAKVYDKKDANKDGKVTQKEKDDYASKHPDEAENTAMQDKLTGTAPYERKGETINTQV